MTYAEKLKDPRWQRKRLEIMERDGFACTWCGDDESTLNIHHHYYTKGKSPWEYDGEALTTLCEDCHQDIEQKKLEILKCITWEVPFDSIYKLATNVDPFLLSEIASVLAGNGGQASLDARANIAKGIIAKLEEFIACVALLKQASENKL